MENTGTLNNEYQMILKIKKLSKIKLHTNPFLPILHFGHKQKGLWLISN